MKAPAVTSDRQGGFTLVELLVVVLIIAILAAIAVPLFLKQREGAYQGEIVAALKQGSTAAEAYAVANDGNFLGLDADTGVVLGVEGYRASSAVSIKVSASSTNYCLTAEHSMLDPTHNWHIATFDSDIGKATDPDACTP